MRYLEDPSSLKEILVSGRTRTKSKGMIEIQTPKAKRCHQPGQMSISVPKFSCAVATCVDESYYIITCNSRFVSSEKSRWCDVWGASNRWSAAFARRTACKVISPKPSLSPLPSPFSHFLFFEGRPGNPFSITPSEQTARHLGPALKASVKACPCPPTPELSSTETGMRVCVCVSVRFE